MQQNQVIKTKQKVIKGDTKIKANIKAVCLFADFVAYMTSNGAEMFSKLAEVLATSDTENEHLRDLFVKVAHGTLKIAAG